MLPKLVVNGTIIEFNNKLDIQLEIPKDGHIMDDIYMTVKGGKLKVCGGTEPGMSIICSEGGCIELSGSNGILILNDDPENTLYAIQLTGE